MAKKSGVIASTPKQRVNVTLPPGTLGWADLIKPKSFGDDDPGNYSTNLHWTDEELERVATKLQEGFDEALEKYLAANPELEDRKRNTDAAAYLEDKTKTSDKETLGPWITFKLKHKEGVSKKSGRPYVIKPRVWDTKGNILDAVKLALGRDSRVSPVVSIGFFVSPLVKDITPSIRLEGVAVLKRVSIKGTGAFDPSSLGEEISDEEIDDNLASFAAGAFDGPEDDDDDEEAHDAFE